MRTGRVTGRCFHFASNSSPVLTPSDSARKLSSSLSGGHAQKSSGVEIVFARKSARNDS